VSISGGCSDSHGVSDNLPSNKFTGAWQLVEGIVITGKDTVATDYTGDTSLLKIITPTHFAFLMHDKKQGKDSTAYFVAGGGRCELTDSTYTEHLDYCNARDWEGHTFRFQMSFENDTLVQHGRENAEGAGVDRVIIEKYVRAQ
jgi:hypothetical protein